MIPVSAARDLLSHVLPLLPQLVFSCYPVTKHIQFTFLQLLSSLCSPLPGRLSFHGMLSEPSVSQSVYDSLEVRRERGWQSGWLMAYLAWAWEPRHERFCSGSPLRDRRWKAVSNSWESHFPTIFPWYPLKAIYSSLFHHDLPWDTMRYLDGAWIANSCPG